MTFRTAFAALAAVLALACKTSEKNGEGAAKKLDPQAPVAKYDGKTITASELDELVKKDLKQLEQQYEQQKHQLKRQALEATVRQRLVEEKAKAKGVTPEELVRSEVIAKIPQPPEAQLRQMYDAAKAGPNGAQLPPYEEVKGQIANYVQSQQAEGQLASYYSELMKEANVEFLLPDYEPPKVEVAAEGPSKGPENAPVTIVEFSDFECPYCVRAEKTIQDLLAAYPDQIRLVYRDYPLPNHQQAPKAAEAAHCAGDQGKYWEMHARLFAAQGQLQTDALKSYARELGLDTAKFDQCLDSGAKSAEVEKHRLAGEEAGVSGTPAFFINGRLLSGAQPLENFKKIVDQELAKGGKS